MLTDILLAGYYGMSGCSIMKKQIFSCCGKGLIKGLACGSVRRTAMFIVVHSANSYSPDGAVVGWFVVR